MIEDVKINFRTLSTIFMRDGILNVRMMTFKRFMRFTKNSEILTIYSIQSKQNEFKFKNVNANLLHKTEIQNHDTLS